MRKANPGLSEKEFCEVKRAVMLKKAHEARRERLEEKGTIKPVDDLTLKAQQESPSQDVRPYACLILTKEERVAVAAATKMANPDANREDFELAFRIALWKADSQKRGINPGSNEDAVHLSLSSLSDSEDGSGE